MAYSAAHSSRFSASAPLPTTPLARRDSARTAAHPSLQQQLFGPSAAGPSAPPSIIDRPLAKTRGAEVAMGAWAFMFAEIVAYSQSRVDSVSDLEARCAFKPGLGDADSCRLSSLGYDAGQRLLPLLLLRNTQASGIKVRSTIPSIFVLFLFLLSIRLGTQKRTPPYSYTPVHPYTGVSLLLWQGRRRSRTQRRGRK